jgi:hypothetical protein
LRPAALQCGHLVREEAMIGKSDSTLADLSPRVQEVLGDFVEAARVAFGSDLRAVVLSRPAEIARLEQKRADQARRAPRPWWRIWWTWDSGINSS